MKHERMILTGGWMMVLFSLLFVGVPILVDFLSGDSTTLLHLQALGLKIRAGSEGMRTILSIYATLPLLLIPGILGVYDAFHDREEPYMRVGVCFAFVAIISMVLSLMIIPSLNWFLLTDIPGMPMTQQKLIVDVLRAVQNYFGVYVGDVLGLGCLIVWFYLASIGELIANKMPRWVGIVGLFLAILSTVLLILRHSNLSTDTHLILRISVVIALWFFFFGVGLISMRKD